MCIRDRAHRGRRSAQRSLNSGICKVRRSHVYFPALHYGAQQSASNSTHPHRYKKHRDHANLWIRNTLYPERCRGLSLIHIFTLNYTEGAKTISLRDIEGSDLLKEATPNAIPCAKRMEWHFLCHGGFEAPGVHASASQRRSARYPFWHTRKKPLTIRVKGFFLYLLVFDL